MIYHAYITYLSPNVEKVKYQTNGSIGFDLSANLESDIEILPLEHKLIPTGVKVYSPGTGWFIYPRSGLAAKYGITLMNSVGVIDKDYLGEIKICLFNTGKEPFIVKHGMRIAQGVISGSDSFEFKEISIERFEQFDTSRNSGGFGSTGV